MSSNRLLRTTFSIILLAVGIILVLVSDKLPLSQLFSSLGIANIVGAVVTLYREWLILRYETDETGNAIADKVHKRLQEQPLDRFGLRMVAPVRRGYPEYYLWALRTEPVDLFFAGRSVLHRIDADMKARHIGVLEDIVVRRLTEGCNIRILFLDPRSSLIDRLAKEEGQSPEAVLFDIATSIGICVRLYDLLQSPITNPHAQLHVRVYDEVPYFAYHRDGERTIVGFYFATALGSDSSAFEILDAETQKRFEGHFVSIFDRSSDKTLLELSSHRRAAIFHDNVYKDLRSALAARLGETKTDQMIEKHRRNNHELDSSST